MSQTTNPMIPIARPVLDEQEVEAVRRVILSGWVTQGPEVAAFEREFADHVGAPHACAVSNCTTALHLALLAVGVGPGDEVITVSHSFIATANAVRYCGAAPIFIDIDADTYNMDPALVAAAITARTKAILCVHQIGMPCDLARIVEIGQQHGLPVIEDAACAIGSEILWQGRWEKIGRPHGDIACFSFHPRKVLTTGDGGMITTANPEFDRKFRLWRQHSMSVSDAVRHSSTDVIFEQYLELGFNYRLTDLQAAVGRVQLSRLSHLIGRRRTLAANYRELLKSIPGVGVPIEPIWARSNWQSYCVKLPDGCGQLDVIRTMQAAGISTRRGIMCTHREPAYAGRATAGGLLPESEHAQDHTILLPLFDSLTADEQSIIAGTLRKAAAASVARSTH